MGRIDRNYYLKLKADGVADEQLIMLKLDVARNARYRNPLELDKYLRDKISDTKLHTGTAPVCNLGYRFLWPL